MPCNRPHPFSFFASYHTHFPRYNGVRNSCPESIVSYVGVEFVAAELTAWGWLACSPFLLCLLASLFFSMRWPSFIAILSAILISRVDYQKELGFMWCGVNKEVLRI